MLDSNKYIDYGVVKWYDSYKKFGIVISAYHNEIFLTNFKNNQAISEGNKIIISQINERKNKPGQYEISEFKLTDTVGLFNIISKEPQFLSKTQENIKWFLANVDEQILEVILDSKEKDWIYNDGFIHYLVSSYNGTKHKQEIQDLLFSIWIENSNNTFDSIFESLLTRYDINISKFLIKSMLWLYEPAFIKLITSSWNKKALDHNSNICQHILIKNSSNNEYNSEIRWIVKNGNPKFLSRILNIKSLYSEENFLSDIKQRRQFVDVKTFSRFLLDYYCENYNEKVFNEDIKWLIIHCPIELFEEVINFCSMHFSNNEEYLNYLLDLSHHNARIEKSSKQIVDSNKISLIENIFFNLWSNQENKTFDSYAKWIIINGSVQIVNKLLAIQGKVWLENNDFLDLLLTPDFYYLTYPKKEIIKRIINERKYLEYDKITQTYFDNEPIEVLNKVLIQKSNYSLELLNNYYIALFPENNINFYSTYVRNKDWKSDYKATYINQNLAEIEEKYKNLFLNEIKTKSTNLIERKNKRKTTYSATDLANFTFCPASYFLTQTFCLDFSNQDNVIVGINEHEKQRLKSTLKLNDYETFQWNGYSELFQRLNNDFSRLKHSKCINEGHGSDEPQILYSKNKVLCGIPDYIFEDDKGKFAVEEKYTTKKIENFTTIYDSHKIQALTYLYGLDIFDEVYVVYWFLKSNNYGNYTLYGYRLYKLIKNDANRLFLLETYNSVDKTQNKGEEYAYSVNYRKCVKCSCFSYCDYRKEKDTSIKIKIAP